MELTTLVILALVAVLALWAFSWTALKRPYTLHFEKDIGERAEAIKLPKYQIQGPALVTGGAGFLGQHIVDALVGQGVKVVIFDLAKWTPPPGSPVEYVQGDLTKQEQITAALRTHGIRIVFHVASPDPNSTNKALFEAVNVQGTNNVISSCKEAGVKTLIYTSSASVVWQGAAHSGVDESVPYPAAFRDPYAATKARAEAIVMKAGGPELATVSLRPHAIFGPKDRVLVDTVAKQAAAGRLRFIIGDGENIVDWTYVGNVVHAHMLAAQAAQREGAKAACNGRTYFVTNGQPMRFWDFMNWIVLGLGYSPSSRRLPYPLILRLSQLVQAGADLYSKLTGKRVNLTFSPSRMQIVGTPHFYNIDAARRDLGYAPVWPMMEAMFLTLKAFAHLRNDKPRGAALRNARAGNLVALKLLRDVEDPKSALRAAEVPKPASAAGRPKAVVDEAAMPEYTREEVAKHAKRGDVWLIIDGKVYDFTSFVDEHPGGEAEILQHAGGEATTGFHGPQHGPAVFGSERQFLIGKLKAQ